MEISNLTMSLRNDAVKRMISMYASSETNRHRTVERLLTEENPMTIQKIETVEENHNREILDAYLKCLGVCLEN